MSAISAEALQRSFGEVAAVEQVDLEVADGTIYRFLGPNGAERGRQIDHGEDALHA